MSQLNHFRLVNEFLKISQFVTWPIAYVYFHSLYDLRIMNRENLKKVSAPFIIISNHVSFSDSFLFRLILGFSTPHLPLRFLAVTHFNWKWLNFLGSLGIISFVYKIFGVVVIVPGLGIEKNLEESKQIIANGGNIVIYPEGKIVTEHAIAPFRLGAAVLSVSTGAPVLPIVLRLGRRKLIRTELVVNIGEPIHESAETDVKEATSQFYDSVMSLYCEKSGETVSH